MESPANAGLPMSLGPCGPARWERGNTLLTTRTRGWSDARTRPEADGSSAGATVAASPRAGLPTEAEAVSFDEGIFGGSKAR
jgi:hypothetical protein